MNTTANIPAKTEEDKISVPEFIFDMIIEIARHMKNHGLTELDAIKISRDVVIAFEKGNRGTFVRFPKAKNHCGQDKKFFSAILTDLFADKGIKRSGAGKIARTIADKIFFTYGGLTLFFPKDDKKARDVRDSAIGAEYKANPGFKTVKKIAVKDNLGQSRVYAVIRKAGKTRIGIGRKRKCGKS